LSKAKLKIVFIYPREGAAMYPLTKALMASYGHAIDFSTETYESASLRTDLADCICWYTMGHYTKNLPCKFTIHDYRSLSVGRFRRLKDLIKRYTNAKPDLRIIAPTIQKDLNFTDKVKTILMDISVNELALSYRPASPVPVEYDFCYVGAMSAERKTDRMIDDFLRHRPVDSKLLMIGKAEAELVERYKDNANIIFAGPQPQKDVFALVAKSDVAVSYFPNHFPHVRLTPTKLIEYAVLGKKILANHQPMNELKSKQYSIKVVWRNDGELFRDLPAAAEWPDNMDTDPDPMMFSTHMETSGLRQLLEGWAGLPLTSRSSDRQTVSAV